MIRNADCSRYISDGIIHSYCHKASWEGTIADMADNASRSYCRISCRIDLANLEVFLVHKSGCDDFSLEHVHHRRAVSAPSPRLSLLLDTHISSREVI